MKFTARDVCSPGSNMALMQGIEGTEYALMQAGLNGLRTSELRILALRG